LEDLRLRVIDDVPLNLDDPERQNITRHSAIRVVGDDPNSAIGAEDMNEIKRRNMLAKRLGLRINYINGYTWTKLLELFKEGRLDIVHTAGRTPEREAYAIFSKPYKRYKTHFFTRKGSPEVTDFTQLYGKVVAVGKGWSQHEYIVQNHPRIKVLAPALSR
jgi:hypothetical protein